MFLRQLKLTQFKNYKVADFQFQEKVVGISGKNGVGKTNLLDAIYYTCFTKSYFTSSDQMSVQFEKDGFRLEATIDLNDKLRKFSLVFKNGQKKECSIDNVDYEKVSQHIGLFPAVLIAPDDIEIINGNSDIRRRYIDTLLCQLNADYLQHLIRYNKLLQQRNSLLKNSGSSFKMDITLLETIDEQLVPAAEFIFNKRVELMKGLIPMINDMYAQISQSPEEIQIQYNSQLFNDSFLNLLVQHREKDMVLQRTTVGIHKDDLLFQQHVIPFKNIASQGQKKSLLFALKIAEYEWIKKYKGFPPLLLLDDVFEKLDQERMHNLLNRVCIVNDGQVLISDTHEQRLKSSFGSLGISYQIINL